MGSRRAWGDRAGRPAWAHWWPAGGSLAAAVVVGRQGPCPGAVEDVVLEPSDRVWADPTGVQRLDLGEGPFVDVELGHYPCLSMFWTAHVQGRWPLRHEVGTPPLPLPGLDVHVFGPSEDDGVSNACRVCGVSAVAVLEALTQVVHAGIL